MSIGDAREIARRRKMTITKAIEKVLSTNDAPLTAAEIRKKVQNIIGETVTKKRINRVLYPGVTNGLFKRLEPASQHSAPRWTL